MSRKLIMFTVLSAVVSILLAGCGGSNDAKSAKPAPEQKPAAPSDRQLVRRVLFLRLMTEHPYPADMKDRHFFLELEPGEESDIATVYAGTGARPADECVVDGKARTVKAKSDGKDGCLVRVVIAAIAVDAAEAYLVTEPAWTSQHYRLQKRDGAWVIVEEGRLLLAD